MYCMLACVCMCRLTGEDPAVLDLVRRYEHLAVWLEEAENAASSLPVSATDENLKELKVQLFHTRRRLLKNFVALQPKTILK